MGAEPTIVYRDPWVLVVDKPAGLATQATREGEPGLYEWLRRREAYVGLHHRLDRNASGLVLFTLDRSANAVVAEGFRTHTIERTYLARVEGEAQDGSWAWPVDRKPARTDVIVQSYHQGVTDLECRLHTGRKHQIRIHAAMNGTPILGDTRYGGDLTRNTGRLALHAWRLDLVHPITGEPVQAESNPTW